MPKPSWENLDDFLATDDNGGFATPAIIISQDNSRKTVPVIFDDPYFSAQLGGFDADSTQPFITGKACDLMSVRRGDAIKIDGKNYDALTSGQPDGTGMATVKLAISDDDNL
jgi:hypothetical protein